jgi:hypothetical protein
VHGVALNITAQSYHESLDIGIVACARAMPEVAEFAAHVEAAFLELKSLPAAASPAPAPAPAPTTKRRRAVSVTRATRGSPRVAARPARRPSR